MQVVSGMADDTLTIKEALKRIPTRMIRFMLRVAGLKKGRYVVYLSVGSDSNIEWSVLPIEKMER